MGLVDGGKMWGMWAGNVQLARKSRRSHAHYASLAVSRLRFVQVTSLRFVTS